MGRAWAKQCVQAALLYLCACGGAAHRVEAPWAASDAATTRATRAEDGDTRSTALSSPTDAAAPPVQEPSSPPTVDPSLPLRRDPEPQKPAEIAESLAHTLLGSSIAFAWATADGVLVVGARAFQAVEVARELPYPPAAADAAAMGRVVFMTQAWHATRGGLRRVLSTPTHLRPLDCIADEDCTLLELPVQGTADGTILVDRGACAEALAELPPRGAAKTTWEAYDSAAIPALCRQGARFAWDGTRFVASTSLVAAPVTAIDPEVASRRLVETLIGASLEEVALQATFDTDGSHQHLMVTRAPQRPPPSFVARAGASSAWASGRALVVAELWRVGYASVRRTLELPVALQALAAPLVVMRLEVALHGDDLRIGDPGAPCITDSGFAPGASLGGVEAEHAAYDRAAARLVCAGRGPRRFVRSAWARANDGARR